jgi:hypothetical protein
MALRLWVFDLAPLDDRPPERLAEPPRDFRIEWCWADETAPQEIYLRDPRCFPGLETATATASAEAAARWNKVAAFKGTHQGGKAC